MSEGKRSSAWSRAALLIGVTWSVRGGISVFHGSEFHQPPRQVNGVAGPSTLMSPHGGGLS
jgi:hypothetical protein